MTGGGSKRITGYALALIPLLSSCERSPSFDILGSFFPAWLMCFASGVVLTAAARLLLLRLHIPLAFPGLAYPCLAALWTFTLWLVFFR